MIHAVEGAGEDHVVFVQSPSLACRGCHKTIEYRWTNMRWATFRMLVLAVVVAAVPFALAFTLDGGAWVMVVQVAMGMLGIPLFVAVVVLSVGQYTAFRVVPHEDYIRNQRADRRTVHFVHWLVIASGAWALFKIVHGIGLS